jgi:hypothetical protein
MIHNSDIFHSNTNEMTSDSQQLTEISDTSKPMLQLRKVIYIFKLTENVCL